MYKHLIIVDELKLCPCREVYTLQPYLGKPSIQKWIQGGVGCLGTTLRHKPKKKSRTALKN